MALSIALLESVPTTGGWPREISLPPSADLAGPESWRRDVYGSPEAVDAGLIVLPTLASGNLVLSGAQLSEVVKEIDILISIIPHISKRLAASEETIRERVHNIRDACTHAAEKGYCVWIS